MRTSTTTTSILLTLSSLTNALPNSTPYSLLASYTAPTFFDNFNFFTGPDPTNGHVVYTNRSDAASNSLVGYIYNTTSNLTSAYIGVDHSTSSTPSGRKSVRLIGKDAWNAGTMIVFDVRHIPVQWGLWPAIWLLGKNGVWPETGESDVLEYVHKGKRNAMTLHTAPGCSVSNSSSSTSSSNAEGGKKNDKLFQGTLVHSDCNADHATTGCSITAPSPPQNHMATAGDSFNAQGGGIYVHDWTATGISIYLFSHSSLPADLLAGHPDSSTWKQAPLARFEGSGCDFEERFRDMNVIINIDFCGDWAGKQEVWEASGALKATGRETCREYVETMGGEFEESYFEIAGIEVFGRK